MQQNKPVRVVKRDQKSRPESAIAPGQGQGRIDLERNVRTAVSGWVREHRQRAEEFRRDHAALLAGLGFGRPRASVR